VQDKNSIRFDCNNEIKTKQGCDKKNVPKIGVEQTKSNGEFDLYLYPLGI
jgi:hypothetical protein